MKNRKKIIALLLGVVVVGSTSTVVLAKSAYSNKAEAVSALTGKNLDEVSAEREAGKSYGEIAKEAGVLEEFKNENIQIQKDKVDEKLANGKITEEKANELKSNIEAKIEKCDGTEKKQYKQDEICNKEENGKNKGKRLGKQQKIKNSQNENQEECNVLK